jgi:hypothetical protein
MIVGRQDDGTIDVPIPLHRVSRVERHNTL